MKAYKIYSISPSVSLTADSSLVRGSLAPPIRPVIDECYGFAGGIQRALPLAAYSVR